MRGAGRRTTRRIGSVALGATIAGVLALAAPGAASAACVSTPGKWTFPDPAGDQWFSPTHSDISALRVEIDAACRLTMELDVFGVLDPEANSANYEFEIGGVRKTLYTMLARPNRPAQEVWLGRPQSGGIGYGPAPALTVSGATGWSGTLDTLGITAPGVVSVRYAAIWEFPLEGVPAGGPTGTGDAMPNEPGTVSFPLAFTTGEPPAPEVAEPPVTVPEIVPPVVRPDRTPPWVSELALRPATLRGGARIAERKALRGAVSTYRLSEAASVALRLQRRSARGRHVWLGRSTTHAGAAGVNKVRLAKLVAGLRPGAYRLVATARDGAGNRGPSRRVGFRVR